MFFAPFAIAVFLAPALGLGGPGDHTITVTDPGDATHTTQFVTVPELGSSASIELAFAVAGSYSAMNTDDGDPDDNFVISLDYSASISLDAEVTEVDSDGGFTIEAAVTAAEIDDTSTGEGNEDATDDLLDSLRPYREYEHLIGVRLAFVFDDDGTLDEVEAVGDVTDEQEDAIDDVDDNTFGLATFPDEPVGAGAEWTVAIEDELPLHETLTSLEGDEFVIDSRGGIDPESGDTVPDDVPDGATSTISAHRSGSVSNPLDRRAEASIDSALSGEIEEADTVLTMELSIDQSASATPA